MCLYFGLKTDNAWTVSSLLKKIKVNIDKKNIRTIDGFIYFWVPLAFNFPASSDGRALDCWARDCGFESTSRKYFSSTQLILCNNVLIVRKSINIIHSVWTTWWVHRNIGNSREFSSVGNWVYIQMWPGICLFCRQSSENNYCFAAH